jgi:DNA (cytosine-5)-methyltransferase 1
MRAIDLFCGTGGFSHGAHAAGFEVAAAFDSDPTLTSSFRYNFPRTKLVLGDLSRETGARILKVVGGPVDLVFGGPPCQGFSSIGRRRKDDPRRTLLGHFFRLISEVRPKAFVMENVQGLAYRDALPELQRALTAVPAAYKVLGPLVLDAADFGAATTRKRVFVVGYDESACHPISEADIARRKTTSATVADALSGLVEAQKLVDEEGFDIWQIPEATQLSSYAARLADNDRRFTGNRRTSHSNAVRDRFATVHQGGVDPIGRHHRLSWGGQCPTLRAGTGSDMGSYQSVRPLHPDEPRVITVREAARLQGFPDRHLFHPTIWHSFRMIGNSVSPFIAECVLGAVAEKLAGEKVAREAA